MPYSLSRQSFHAKGYLYKLNCNTNRMSENNICWPYTELLHRLCWFWYCFLQPVCFGFTRLKYTQLICEQPVSEYLIQSSEWTDDTNVADFECKTRWLTTKCKIEQPMSPSWIPANKRYDRSMYYRRKMIFHFEAQIELNPPPPPSTYWLQIVLKVKYH